MRGIILVLTALGLAASAARPLSAPRPAVTFARDVAPLLYVGCAPCHRPGEVAPFPLVTYDDARKRARQIALVTQKRTMPPWKPQPGHGDFLDTRRLTAAQVSMLTKWAELGAPAGDLSQAPIPPKPRTGWQLGTPDTILRLPAPFAIPAEGDDVYQHFVFSLGPAKERYLRAIEVRPGNRRVAHHAVGLIDVSGAARRLDAQTPEPGYRNMGGPGFVPVGFTPGYVPGQTPRFADDGTAITLPKGGDFVLQMHYHPTGRPETDQTEVGLYFTNIKPKRGPSILLLGSNDIDIAPGNSAYRVSDMFTLPADFNVENVWAHMHLIGKEVRVWAELPDGSRRRLLWIDDWDFNWQDTYRYRVPLRLPAKTIIRAEFTFDNSSANPRNPNRPPRRVLTGENSTDEMAGLILGGYVDNDLAGLAILAADIGHYFEMEGKAAKAKAEAQKVKKAVRK